MQLVSLGSLLAVSLICAVAASAPTAETRTVTVDGYRMRVRVAGMRRIGQVPTVVFEAALRERLESWDSVFEGVAAFAPAVAYDRAGNGDSADDGQLPTPGHVAHTLHALLAAIGAKPPYVLVGHSWGGPLVRMYAALYPAQVAGIVYIDPTDLRPLHEEVTYYREQGYVGQAMAERKASRRPPGMRLGEDD